jgi:hypothetical protein
MYDLEYTNENDAIYFGIPYWFLNISFISDIFVLPTSIKYIHIDKQFI